MLPPPVDQWNSCCVSIQGLHPLKDSAFAVFEGESFRETLLTSSDVLKWNGLAFAAFPGCVTRCFTLISQFLPPRSAGSDDLHHVMSPFSLFLSVFFGRTNNLGVCEGTKDCSGASYRNREMKAASGGAFGLGQPSRSIVT